MFPAVHTPLLELLPGLLRRPLRFAGVLLCRALGLTGHLARGALRLARHLAGRALGLAGHLARLAAGLGPELLCLAGGLSARDVLGCLLELVGNSCCEKKVSLVLAFPSCSDGPTTILSSSAFLPPPP